MSEKITIEQEWTYLLSESGQEHLHGALSAYLPKCRWFQSKSRQVGAINIVDVVPMENLPTQLVFVNVKYDNDIDEVYLLPVKFLPDEDAQSIIDAFPVARIVDVRCTYEGKAHDGKLIDAIYDAQFRGGILTAIGDQQEMTGDTGSVDADVTSAFEELHTPQLVDQSRLLGKEQSNTSIRYSNVLVLKLMRKLEEGVNPELEIGRFLTEETAITHVPMLAGYMQYRRMTRQPTTIAVLQGFVQNQGDAWEFTLDWLGHWFQSGILARTAPTLPESGLTALAYERIPTTVQDEIGDYLDKARLLGQRTGELHVALTSGEIDKFRPVPFSMTYQKDLYNSIDRMSDRIFTMLHNQLHQLPEAVIPLAQTVLEQEDEIRAVFKTLNEYDIPGQRIRGHGDYHLGQVLYTKSDFVIVDFEGEPARPLPERYIKHSPLRDIAGMLRSFHYAAYGTLPGFGLESTIPQEKLTQAEPWARYWRIWVSVAFLQGYLEHVAPAQIIPANHEDFELLLRILVMEKAVYELGYEMNNRPGWLKVPAQAITHNID